MKKIMEKNKILKNLNSATDFDEIRPSKKFVLEVRQNKRNFINSESLDEQTKNDRLDKHGLKNTNYQSELSNSSVKNIKSRSQIKFYRDLSSCRKSTPIQDFNDYSVFDGDSTIKNVITKCIGDIDYFKLIDKNSDDCNLPENQHKSNCKNKTNNRNSNDSKQNSFHPQNETISAKKIHPLNQYAQSVSYLNTFIRENSYKREKSEHISNYSPFISKFHQGNTLMKNESKSESNLRSSSSPSIKRPETIQNLIINSYLMKSVANLELYLNPSVKKHIFAQNFYYGIKMPTHNHYNMNRLYGNTPNHSFYGSKPKLETRFSSYQKKIEDFSQPKMQYTPRVERKYNFIGVEEVDPKKYAAQYGSELVNTSKLPNLEITKWAETNKNYIFPFNTRLASKKHSSNKKYLPPKRNFA